MKRIETEGLSFDEFDEVVNPRPEETDFDRIVEAAIDRRGFLGGVLAFGSFATAGRRADRPAVPRSRRESLRIRPDRAPTATTPSPCRPATRWTCRRALGRPAPGPDAPEFDHATRGDRRQPGASRSATTTTAWTFSRTTAKRCWSSTTSTRTAASSGATTRTPKPHQRRRRRQGHDGHGVSVMEIARSTASGGWSRTARTTAASRRKPRWR